METKTERDFGLWLAQKRSELGLTKSYFNQLDVSALIRAERGTGKIRMFFAMQIFRRINIQFVEAADILMGLQVDPDEGQQIESLLHHVTTTYGKGLVLNAVDIFCIVEAYRAKNTAVFDLVGEAILRIASHNPEPFGFGDQSMTWGNETAKIIGRLVLSDKVNPRFEWDRAPVDLAAVTKTVADGGIITVHDAHAACQKMVTRYNTTAKIGSRITKSPGRFNRELVKLEHIIDYGVHLPPEQATKMFCMFWYGFQLDVLLCLFWNDTGKQIKQWRVIADFITTLWQWINYIGDEDDIEWFVRETRNFATRKN